MINGVIIKSLNYCKRVLVGWIAKLTAILKRFVISSITRKKLVRAVHIAAIIVLVLTMVLQISVIGSQNVSTVFLYLLKRVAVNILLKLLNKHVPWKGRPLIQILISLICCEEFLMSRVLTLISWIASKVANKCAQDEVQSSSMIDIIILMVIGN